MTKPSGAIRGEKGESLIEGVVSLLILAIALAGVAAMINYAVSLNYGAIAAEGERQGAVNAAVLGGHGGGESAELTLKIRDADGSPESYISIGVDLTSQGGYTSFVPAGAP